MNKKGFTLIELLAVIVILAIIALIATPIILGIINDSKKQSKQRTAELVAKEVSLAYTSYMFKNTNEPSNVCDYLKEEYFQMDNLKSITCNNDEATVTMNNNDTYTLKYEEGKVTVSGTGKDVVVKVGSSDSSSNVVYRNSSDELYIGDSIEGIETTKDPKTLGKRVYLKHELEGNIIINSEVCFIKDNNLYCLKPNDLENSKATLLQAFGEGSCNSGAFGIRCSASRLYSYAYSDGSVDANDASSRCRVYEDGNSNCGVEED